MSEENKTVILKFTEDEINQILDSLNIAPSYYAMKNKKALEKNTELIKAFQQQYQNQDNILESLQGSQNNKVANTYEGETQQQEKSNQSVEAVANLNDQQNV
jgi:hypothetical protein